MSKSTFARYELERGCDLYEKGELEEAFLAFYHAAKLGNSEAQVNLANLYDEGKGVEYNPKQAAYWYKLVVRKALPVTSAIAAYNLAISYKRQSKAKWALFWFKRASDMGDEDATDELNNW